MAERILRGISALQERRLIGPNRVTALNQAVGVSSFLLLRKLSRLTPNCASQRYRLQSTHEHIICRLFSMMFILLASQNRTNSRMYSLSGNGFAAIEGSCSSRVFAYLKSQCSASRAHRRRSFSSSAAFSSSFCWRLRWLSEVGNCSVKFVVADMVEIEG